MPDQSTIRYRSPRSVRTDVDAPSPTVHAPQVREALATLERGIAAILTSEGFARYLHAMSRFPTYSPQNIALIHTQRPDATHPDCG